MKKKLTIIGVTGSFASGKTTVAGMFKNLGASCIDVDSIYHKLIDSDQHLYLGIVSVFGRGILKRNKKIDRKKLGKSVFSNGRELKKLCQITHPVIIKAIKARLAQLKASKSQQMVIIDAPLLFESGLSKMMDYLIVVKTSKKNQIARSSKVRKMLKSEIIKRINSQLPIDKKIKLAHFVIDNNDALLQTKRQVEKIWKKIQLNDE